ncbi:MAG TPA: hypothetical protein VNO35_01660 [Steroidobacteraceae bacterium]|nr:hypothetical protein [Steroidobacteraceae bacterium]
MHELVIVLSDLYLSQESPERELPAGVSLPGLQHAARSGARSRIAGGWRSWLARWLTGREAGGPAAVAAAALQVLRPSIVWMATPVHLIAGLTSVHVDRRSILRLDADDQTALVADFQRVFHDSGFQLQPLASGDFLMLGPQMPIADTPEPARTLGAGIADAQRSGAANPALRRLGAEIEMWLHDHAVNDARSRRGEPPVTALWLWGAGSVVAADASDHASGDRSNDTEAAGAPRAAGDRLHDGTASSPRTSGDTSINAAAGAPRDSGGASNDAVAGVARASASTSTDIAFGRDAYLQGLWATRGAKVFPLPQQLADVFSYPQAQRAVLVIEIGLMLQSHPTWTFFDAVAQIDRSFIAPAIEALNRGQCDRLVILANDYQLTLQARDRLKFWRRTPPGLSGLQ